MKYFIFLAMLMMSVVVMGAAPLSTVPTATEAYKVDKWMGPVALDVGLGTMVREAHKVATGVYDFSLVGGTTAATTLTVGIDLPDNAIITWAVFETLTTPTSGSSTDICFTTGESACDLSGYVAKASWSGFTEGTPDNEVGNFVKLTAARSMKATVSGASVTAGKIKVYLHYLLSE